MMIVPPFGPQPAKILLVGEAPGRQEAKEGRPFVDPAGEEQLRYLVKAGVGSWEVGKWRMINIIQEYQEGNPDPTPQQIEQWAPVLLAEIEKTRPQLILAVGRFATRWFLGPDADMDTVWGVVHRAGSWGESWYRGDVPILPLFHPAAGLHNSDMRSKIQEGYRRVGKVWAQMKQSGCIPCGPQDEYEGREDYREWSDSDYTDLVSHDTVAIDTEGYLDAPWSIQMSWKPGMGRLVRYCPENQETIACIGAILGEMNYNIIMHNAMYDIGMCRAMGLELRDRRIWDTMYASYLTRLEPQGLKALAWRWCGMKMGSFDQLQSTGLAEKWVAYLAKVGSIDWGKPDPVVVELPDGGEKWKSPKRINAMVSGILADWESGKVNKDGEGVKFDERWDGINVQQRMLAEEMFGAPPKESLNDVDLRDVVYYGCRDTDATFRLWGRLKGRVYE